MSYDIRFGVKVAGAPKGCYAVIGEPEYDSPTYNLRDIFVTCMDWDYKQGEWYPITEVMPKIRRGIAELTMYPKKYKKLEPENGWGTIGNAARCLISVVNYFDPENFSGLAGGWNADIPIECIYMSW